MKKKIIQTIRIELQKDGKVTDWSEYYLGNRPPNITGIIKHLIEFLEETL